MGSVTIRRSRGCECCTRVSSATPSPRIERFTTTSARLLTSVKGCILGFSPFSMAPIVLIASLVWLQPMLLGQTSHNDQWISSDEFDEDLGEYSVISEYRIRIPKNYKRVELQQAPKGIEVAVWSGPQREDGTASVIQLTVIEMPDNERITKLDDLMVAALKDVQSRRSNWTQSDFRLGKIAGIGFLRADWEGMAANSDRKLRGIVLTGLHDNRAIVLRTQEVEPHDEQGLSLSLNSLFTFQAKP